MMSARSFSRWSQPQTSGSGIPVRTPNRVAEIWDRPVPRGLGSPAPLVWLLGAHGGAGISTLGHVLDFASECGQKWPAPLQGESPFVAIVARERVDSLDMAGDLIRQHVSGMAGNSTLLGLITIADRPGRKIPREIDQTRKIVGGLAPTTWRIEWIEHFTLIRDLRELPVWSHRDPVPENKKRAANDPTAVPSEIAEIAGALRNSIISRLHPGT